MKKRILFVIIAIVCALSIFLLPACGNGNNSVINGNNSAVTSIEITKDGAEVTTDINASVGDKIDLGVKANDGSVPAITWSSSKPEVATVEGGKLEVKGAGTAIITATVTGGSVSDVIFVNAKQKVEQTGVGSGKSADDPIFLGNEGKDEPLEITFIEMTQIYADSIFIKKGNVEVLIDAGWQQDGTYISSFLKNNMSDDILDMFIVTHADGDHVDGIANALKDVANISLMIDFGGVASGNVKTTREKYTAKGMQYHSAYDCANQKNGATNRYYLTNELFVDILNTGAYIENDASGAGNPNSVATLFNYKKFKFFTAGDLTSESESKLLKNEALPNVTLYKAAHHGSHGSNSTALLNTLDPQAVAISAARAGTYGGDWQKPTQGYTYNLNGASGHPIAGAIERIYKAPKISTNLNVYWNMVCGDMKFTSYGEDNYQFKGTAARKGYYDLTKTEGKAVWNEEKQDFENRVTGEENFKLHQAKVFVFRDYVQYLPEWAKKEFFPQAS